MSIFASRFLSIYALLNAVNLKDDQDSKDCSNRYNSFLTFCDLGFCLKCRLLRISSNLNWA